MVGLVGHSKRKLSSILSPYVKNRIRGLGWGKVPDHYIEPAFCYLNSSFRKSIVYQFPEDPLLNKQLSYEQETFSPYRYQEFIIELKETSIVEPLVGAVILKNRLILEQAFDLPTGYSLPLPFFPKALYRSNKPEIHVPQAITLRHWWGDNNYFHFYNDILPRLALLKELQVFQDLPIIISKRLYEKSYFKEFIELANLGHRQWIIQDNEYIRIDSLILVKANELSLAGIERNLKLLNFQARDSKSKRKIFLYRPPNTGRHLLNAEAILQLCQNMNFELIDSSQLSLKEQINLFSESRVVAGEHGAAFSNIIYRYGNSLEVLEIFSKKHVSTCYFLTSKYLGYNYYSLRAKTENQNGYEIEISVFKERLEKLLFNMGSRS